MSVTHDIDVEERFRAELSSVSTRGVRKWIYARQPQGTLYRWRTAVAAVLIGFFVAAPFVHLHGLQFMLLNLLERRFVLFGVPFWPQDMWLLVLVFLLCIVSVVLLTATIGRVWCGWMCPQTLFMEMVFRRLEWLIEGSPAAQFRRNSGAWTTERSARFALKHIVFFGIAFMIANVFLAYLVSSDTLLGYVMEGPSQHLDIIVPLVLFTVVFYMVFARFREQACIIACPYGRYMSSLVDERTLSVTYDVRRGEPRGKGRHREALGACVDCSLCVSVCPTGIDIRNGIQLECVQCTACIDACNDVMKKTGQATGLIRYANSVVDMPGAARWRNGRILAYGLVWMTLTVTVVALMVSRQDVESVIFRQEGTTWIRRTDGIANIFRFEVTNRTSHPITIGIRPHDASQATATLLGTQGRLQPYQQINGKFLVSVPYGRERSYVDVDVIVGGSIAHTERLSMLTPARSRP